MTKSGIKKEDYRAITPYFCNKFLLILGETKSKAWWQKEFFDFGTDEELIENLSLFAKFKEFDSNIMTLGYPKKGDEDKTLILEHKGFRIGLGNQNWGAKPLTNYFVLIHGEIK